MNETPTHYAHNFRVSFEAEIRVGKEGDTNLKNGFRDDRILEIYQFFLTDNKFSVLS
jgi:hypothetical protein